MIVLIDNGHGEETPGKSSPDGRLKEYAYTREIADMVVQELSAQGLDARRIVPENTDVLLKERCKRANTIYKESGRKAILISIHCNASGMGKEWMKPHGWSVFISKNASAKSKQLATCLADSAKEQKVSVRQPCPEQPYWMESLAICRDTNCPAVLTENFFQDNKEDVEFLLSEEGKRTVAQIHVKGIIDYLLTL